MGKLLAAPAHFPDPFIRLLPMRLKKFYYRHHERPIWLSHLDSGTIALPHRGEHFAINIELELVGSRIADAHRPGVLIAGQPRNLIFNKSAFAAHAVDRLHLRWASCDRAQQPLAPRGGFLQISRAIAGSPAQ